jgi:hypothetical protein
MTRKSQWLPGQTDRAYNEPGLANNDKVYNYGTNYGQMRTPLAGFIVSAAYIVMIVVLDVFLLSMPNLNGPGPVILIVADVVFVGLGIFYFVTALRRLRWRRRNIALTGGRYLRAWERTPRGLGLDRSSS